MCAKLLMLLLIPVLSQGALLEFIGKPQRTISPSGLEMSVYQEAFLKVADTPDQKLYLTGWGIREKSVSFLGVKVNVYLATSYSEDSKPGMDFLKVNKTKAIQLTFLRDVPADKIRKAFEEALEKNAIDTKSPTILSLLSKLQFDLAKGERLTLAAIAGNQSQKLYVDSVRGSYCVESPMIGSDMWKIWFGIPVDSGMEALRSQLIGRK